MGLSPTENLDIIENLILHGNNKMNINFIKNAESQHCIKYIDVQHYYIWELVNKRKLMVKWIPSSEIATDRITKVLPTETF